jgi:TDG/mug DNA glycosylase family protein
MGPVVRFPKGGHHVSERRLLKAKVIREKLRQRSVFLTRSSLLSTRPPPAHAETCSKAAGRERERVDKYRQPAGQRPCRPNVMKRRNVKATRQTKRDQPTPEQLRVAYGKSIPDIIAPNLRLLFVGINPSLYSAAVGHHFARPGNRFWPTLHGAGFTDRLLAPSEQKVLLERGYGITNVVDGATARADELTLEDLSSGIKRLEKRVRRHRPDWVAFLGISTYQAVFNQKSAAIGPQQARFGGAHVWLLPNPSGLNAHYQLASLVRLFGELRSAVSRAPRRKGTI